MADLVAPTPIDPLELAIRIVESAGPDKLPEPFWLLGGTSMQRPLVELARGLVDARTTIAKPSPYELTANDRDAIGMHARDFAKWIALGDADGNARSFDDIVDRLERLLAIELKNRGESPIRRRL